MTDGAESLGGGRYVLGELLGSGGMGLVRRAHDTLLDRSVAIKLLADNLAADDDARARFEREARAAAQMTHPNVVQVFDVGEATGEVGASFQRPYLVMEYVDGGNLAEAVRDRGPFDPEDVVGVAAQSLSGLARAHAAGLLHRDLKPANLMRGSDGSVKVTDFGVAQAAEQPGLTRTGFVIGTQSYLAPEREAGGPATVATDLYALGATLLELLTGAPPRQADSAGDGGHDAHAVGPGTPEGLALLIRACLDHDPTRRPASAEAALHLLATGRVEDAWAWPASAESTAPAVGSGAPGPSDTGGTRELAADENVGWGPARTSGPTRVPARRIPPAVLVAAAFVVLLLLALAAASGSDPPAEEPAGEPAQQQTERSGEVEPVPRGDTPADTARNLAEWLRANSG